MSRFKPYIKKASDCSKCDNNKSLNFIFYLPTVKHALESNNDLQSIITGIRDKFDCLECQENLIDKIHEFKIEFEQHRKEK